MSGTRRVKSPNTKTNRSFELRESRRTFRSRLLYFKHDELSSSSAKAEDKQSDTKVCMVNELKRKRVYDIDHENESRTYCLSHISYSVTDA